MAKSASNLLSGLSNSKTRTFVLLFGAILVLGIGFAITRGKKGEDVLSKQGSQAVAVPSSIKATPGAVVSEKYRELQIAENEKRAQEAMQKKSSAIPTIIGAVGESSTRESADVLALEQALKQQGQGNLQLGQAQGSGLVGEFGTSGAGPGGVGKSQRQKEQDQMENRLKAQRDSLEKQRLEAERQKDLERQRQLALQQQKEYEASLTKIEGVMKNYATGAYTDWTKITPQSFVQGQLASKPFKSSSPAFTSSSFGTTEQSASQIRFSNPAKAKQRLFIKAGTVLFGVMDTAVNSDEVGPILATVVSGKYQGSKLIGNFVLQPQQESVVMSFSQMSIPKRLKGINVNVVAIDPDTARTALASDVDHHYLLRYSALFAASLVQGYAQAISQSGTTQTVSPLTGTTTTSTPPLNNKEKLLVALGTVGTRWSQAVQPLVNKPYTVTVDQGTSVGLLFLTDAEISAVVEEEGKGK